LSQPEQLGRQLDFDDATAVGDVAGDDEDVGPVVHRSDLADE
jgi:hypothetical protein